MDQTPIVSLAAGHPLIDIDLTAVVHVVLFLALFAVANRFLFQPYLQLRERRRAGIEGAREEAERMTAEAEAKFASYEKQIAVARERAGEEGRKIRLEGIAHEREVTNAARAEAQKASDEAQATMRRETEAARSQLMPQAEALSRAISAKLLGREVA